MGLAIKKPLVLHFIGLAWTEYLKKNPSAMMEQKFGHHHPEEEFLERGTSPQCTHNLMENVGTGAVSYGSQRELMAVQQHQMEENNHLLQLMPEQQRTMLEQNGGFPVLGQ